MASDQNKIYPNNLQRLLCVNQSIDRSINESINQLIANFYAVKARSTSVSVRNNTFYLLNILNILSLAYSSEQITKYSLYVFINNAILHTPIFILGYIQDSL